MKLRQKINQGSLVTVFLPTTPNPTSGFMLFVPKDDIIILDMSVEDAAKLIISAGLVMPEKNKKKVGIFFVFLVDYKNCSIGFLPV